VTARRFAMSYLDRIAECNRHDLARFLPFRIGAQRLGWIRRDHEAPLLRHREICRRDGGLALHDDLADFAARSRALAELVADLHGSGELPRVHGEMYPVKESFTDAPAARIDRAAAPYFGVRQWGLHVNGFVRRDGSLHMWVARRSRHKPTYPGLLDNMVAGGQPIGLSLQDNLLKECAEEASLPADLAQRALPVGAITYCHETEIGIKPDYILCYDLELTADFAPRCGDDEVESFELWPLARVAATVEGTRAFKPNCNLVVIDFLVRHGAIAADHPDYFAIARGLRAGVFP
jgi:isopentenyldiphosphate isomerase